MSELNSILLEGTIDDGPVVDNGKVFIIVKNKTVTITVTAESSLAENVLSLAKIGRKCRIVGGLLKDDKASNKIIIQATHIEFRPEASVSGKKNKRA